jgi:insertion element IS1 protein InsB
VNPLLAQSGTEGREVRLIAACEEAELDEQWSYVGNKSNQRWFWYAVDHATNTVLAYVFGKRKDEVFKELKALLTPFNINRYYTDDWGAYERHLEAAKHNVGKRNTQKIERKNLNFRTWIKRLNRKTICFSKLECMHDTVIGLLINKVEFGLALLHKSVKIKASPPIKQHFKLLHNFQAYQGLSFCSSLRPASMLQLAER